NVTALQGLEPVLRKRFGEGALPPQATFFRIELENLCRAWLEDALVALPGRPVRPGETWQQQTERALVPAGRHVLTKTFTAEGTAGEGGNALTRLAVTGASALLPYRDRAFY